jgi:hypothetical protein
MFDACPADGAIHLSVLFGLFDRVLEVTDAIVPAVLRGQTACIFAACDGL